MNTTVWVFLAMVMVQPDPNAAPLTLTRAKVPYYPTEAACQRASAQELDDFAREISIPYLFAAGKCVAVIGPAGEPA